jgi:hypothetical protein
LAVLKSALSLSWHERKEKVRVSDCIDQEEKIQPEREKLGEPVVG